MTVGVVALPVPPEIRALADELAPGRWPTADVATLYESAARCRRLATRLAAVVAELDAAHRRGSGGSGQFREGLDAGYRDIVASSDSALARTAERLQSAADSLERYAEAAVATHNDMTVIASVADRERLRGDLMASLGDDSARVVAAGAGRMALTAAGDDYTDQATDAGRHDGDHPPAATSGMMPFSALGPIAAGAGVLAGSHAAAAGAESSEMSVTDAEWLQRRAAALQSALPASVTGWVRMAVGVGRGPDGARTLVVGTDECYPYERDGVGIGAAETLVGDGQAAELAIIDHMARHGIRCQAIAAATPMDAATVASMADTDTQLFAPDAHGSDDVGSDFADDSQLDQP